MIKEQLSKFFNLDSLLRNLTGFVETRVEVLKLEIKEEIASALSKVILFIVLGFVITLAILFLSVSLAVLLGEHLGYTAGFGIVSGGYLVVVLVLVFFRENISRTFERMLSNVLKKKR